MNTEAVNSIVEEYDTVWYISDFWPGEYPRRFSIIGDDVLLEARSEMRLSAHKGADCSVPKYATYSPWNSERNLADNIKFRTVSKVSTVTITGSVSLTATKTLAPEGQSEITLNLNEGDSLQFLIYAGEGFALYGYQGDQILISESDFQGKAQFEEDSREDDLWLELRTTRGERGWVLFSDAIATDGVIETDNEGYGEANDLPDPATLTLQGVVFVSGVAELTEDSKNIVHDLALQLRQVRDLVFEIGGHTDSQGSAESNQRLSQQRAQAVVDYFVNVMGLGSAIFRVKGYGEAHPIADNNTAEGREANRRVELKIV